MKEPVPLSEALLDYIAKRGIARSNGNTHIQSVWFEVCGERFRTATCILRLHRGILEIGVSTAAILNELNSFYYDTFLAEIHSRYGCELVRELRFLLKTRSNEGN